MDAYLKYWFLMVCLLAAGDLLGEKHPTRFEKAAWLEDFRQLKSQVSRYYANLDDKVKRGLDPFSLSQTSERLLSGSLTDSAAFLTIVKFVAAFQDGHFRIENFDEAARKYLGAKKILPFKLTTMNGNVVFDGEPTPGCALKSGDTILEYDDQPIASSKLYFESLQNSFNALEREDLALSNMVKGYFINKTVTLRGRNEETTVRCEFESKILDEKTNSLATGSEIFRIVVARA